MANEIITITFPDISSSTNLNSYEKRYTFVSHIPGQPNSQITLDYIFRTQQNNTAPSPPKEIIVRTNNNINGDGTIDYRINGSEFRLWLNTALAGDPTINNTFSIVQASSNSTSIQANGTGREWDVTLSEIDGIATNSPDYTYQDAEPIGSGDGIISIEPTIQGQQIVDETIYAYLYEPFRLNFTGNLINLKKMFFRLIVNSTEDGSNVDDIINFGEFDIIPNLTISVDLMEMVKQYHDSNIYKYSDVDDIVENSDNGWSSVVSKYKYNFEVTTDVVQTDTKTISILPIIGGRIFEDYDPLVLPSNNLNEAEIFNVDLKRWSEYPVIESTLNNDPNGTNSIPSISKVIPTEGKVPCGGYLIWKSIYGGWMSWGFDIIKKKYNKSYKENIKVGMFRSNLNKKPFIEADYTSVDLSYTLNLKSLSLSKDELKAVSGINFSPAVYFMKEPDGRLELMRLTSAITPLENLNNGGDFSVSLKNISKTMHDTR